MESADGRLVLVFNGEIYNHQELRRSLMAEGCVFRSQSDTEVLLHLYEKRGVDMVNDLRGMFAFAIWDIERQRLLLARDPYGIKPLYYADNGSTFRFASQVKALLAGGQVSRDPEPAGEVGFYLWGSVPEPFTTYRQVRALAAGSTVIVDRDGIHDPKRYHSIAGTYNEAENDACRQFAPDEIQVGIRDALKDTVRHHLVSDVPVGAFLSAGIDSGALVGLMCDLSDSKIQTVTLAFEEFQGRHDDEAPIASKVARKYGTLHTKRIVTHREFQEDLPRILEAMDQPSIDGVNTWFVSKAARELGLKVAISGLGGDELFGGYPSFRDIPRWVRLFALPSRLPHIGVALRRAAGIARLDRVGLNPKAPALVEYGGNFAGAYFLRRALFMPWELGHMLDRDTIEEGLNRLKPLQLVEDQISPRPNSPFAKIATLEASLYMRNQLLRDADWASMAHSVEVRTPLVDSILLKRVASFGALQTAGSPKSWLANAPSEPLPKSVAQRKKTGFILPVESWSGERTAQINQTRLSSSRDWARFVANRETSVGTAVACEN
jgi:asparagine synthase (glutamine-hydrolysing)